MRLKLATALLGDTIAANLFMVGYAWQRGTGAAFSKAALMKRGGVERRCR